MSASPAAIRRDLIAFDFGRLFREELGWDNFSQRYEIPIDGRSFKFDGVAQKRGFQAFRCTPTILATYRIAPRE